MLFFFPFFSLVDFILSSFLNLLHSHPLLLPLSPFYSFNNAFSFLFSYNCSISHMLVCCHLYFTKADMLERLALDERLEKLPEWQATVKQFTTSEIIAFPLANQV